jgi:hypothetical protein
MIKKFKQEYYKLSNKFLGKKERVEYFKQINEYL